ncbi:DUF4456 domain-containing protein [Lamellibrachia satsuma]|nr:DUF4456 domain-containing protein [Lamellibrachia satsuma]
MAGNERLILQEPLPLAVSEVLSTKKGTTFYVMSVAANAYDLPPMQLAGEPAEYISEITIPHSLIADIKKMICLNFLNHLEEWTEQGTERSHSVVAAKTEELNSELDLRLHLHKPRASRAELDVHHVRAAELIMHSERVSRHCKGIKLSLSELKRDFTNMNQSHNKLTEKFKQDIESLQVIFVNATKSSKLIALSNQLQVEKEKYMEVIRASLRVFRQKLDDTLQMLRESNARFIKSFKVFSDGGNFCPEEIDGYRKKLEQMSQKIDKSEGSVMSDLEGIESKRLDQATKIASEFEERFKHHMVDLLFMERIARWLTNTQVKIKAEVAESNSEARRCFNSIAGLHQRIDACEKPNPDKPQVTSTQLYEGLSELFHLFYRRGIYLNCIKSLPASDVQSSGAASVHGAQQVTRVGFPSEASIQSVSKPGKPAIDDPSIGIIKTILKTQKEKLQSGLEAEISPEQILVSLGPHTNVLAPPPGGQSMMSSGGPLASDNRDKGTRSRGSHHSETRSHRSNRSGTGSVSETREKRGHSAGRSSKIDKKYFVFGEVPEEGEELHLMGRINGVLRETLDGLLTASEMYYRQKKERPVTRPQALEETFEHCAETVVYKLQSYLVQADEYHNKCLQELREQLVKFERQMALVPQLLVEDKVQESMKEAEDRRSHLNKEANEKLKELEKIRLQHQDKLRPQLGHPQKDKDLQLLCESEETRRVEYLELVEQFYKQKQTLVVEQASVFIDKLASTGENMLLNFDNFLTVDDVIKGRVPPTKYPTSELLRRKKAGEPLEDDEDKNQLPRGKKIWHGIPKTELVVSPQGESKLSLTSKLSLMSKSSSKSTQGSKRPKKELMTASVVSAKTTLGHSAAVDTRDKAYQKYKEFFEHCLAEVEAERQRIMVAEQRWTDSWHASVEKVKLLYEA